MGSFPGQSEKTGILVISCIHRLQLRLCVEKAFAISPFPLAFTYLTKQHSNLFINESQAVWY